MPARFSRYTKTCSRSRRVTMQFCSSFAVLLTFAGFGLAQGSSQQVPFFLSPAEDTVPQWVRDARNTAYNVRPGRPSMIDPEESVLLPLTVVDFAPQPELPYAKSDVVVVGNITHLQAFLSADKKNIYTEYTLQVVEHVKNAVGVPTVPGDSLTRLRKGG